MAQLPRKSEPVDEHGVPLPWVPPTPRAEGLTGPGDRDGDVEEVPPGAALEPLQGDDDAELRAALQALCRLRGLPVPELEIRPTVQPRRGFCAGRVWMRGGVPLRIRLRPAPNSDRAELLATLAHEVAHPVSRRGDHGAPFRSALLDLCRDHWGASWFAAAAPSMSYRDVDRWVASGIRAALSDRQPPRPKTGDEGQTARIVARIRKLHRLADHRPGTPEAITAAGRANDLVTVYGLGGYQVQIDAGIDEQMVDRWIVLAGRAVWKRSLAHAVARFFGVFSLAMARQNRMHFFGRYADVVATVYLVEICQDKLERACDGHIARWKIEDARTGGEVRSERTRFLDNAVLAFDRKLRDIKDQEPGAEAALDEAEDFAAEEHSKRGQGWRRGRRRTIERHEAGQAAGRALNVVRGVGSGKTRKRLS